jgi:hypothetical protein
MMILADSLLYGIDLKLNKLASNIHQDIPLENKIIALNEAQIKLIKQKLSTNNVHRLGLDAFKKRYEDLQILVEPHKSIKITKDNNSKNNRYYSEIKDLSPKYMFFIDAFILADKTPCKDRQINLRMIKHADLQTLVNNNHYKPSFEYQETLSTISTDKIDVYTDGTFEPKSAHISYIRYPKKIDKEGYINFDGEASENQDCELPEFLQDELIDLAVQELALSTENIPAAQASGQRIQTNE